ncbi:MAG: transporter substrate-binding domain-containing protein [Alcanivoracaceae bacterium]|nr:transporter substrate-binding domain-containing protein [Alcanivoracaceae bacterium]
MMRSRFVLALCLFLFSASTFADVTLVRHPNRLTEWDTRNEYFLSLLSLALEKTRGTDGDYLLEPSAQPMNQGRAINLLSSGEELDVLWSMTTRQRETQMLPVRIPLLKGLMGYRLFIIRAEDTVWFKGIKTLDQLRDLRAGQGHDWPDTDILRANGFRVETNTTYEHLFEMLQAGRFDFFPRALNEPWEEVSARPELNLAVESRLLLYYPTANYFFFQRNNTALADRVRRGLEIAIADGSFDELFNQHPANAFALTHSELSQRRVLKLINPLLPAETPLDRKELWWQAPVGAAGAIPEPKATGK